MNYRGGGAPKNSSLRGKETGFTLAEVLITLGVIGIVAALTFPSIIGYYQKKVLKEQFKVAYSMLSQLLLKSEVDLGGKAECYYWDVNPYGSSVCAEYDSRGGCTKYELSDGSPLPSNYSELSQSAKEMPIKKAVYLNMRGMILFNK